MQEGAMMAKLKKDEIEFVYTTLNRYIASHGGVRQRALDALQNWPGLTHLSPSTLTGWLEKPTVLAYYLALAIEQHLKAFEGSTRKPIPRVPTSGSEVPPLA
jgi:hypothetical protein